MKKLLLTGLALLALASPGLRATTYVFENFNTTLLDANGQPWTASLNLELGGFINGFTPTAANRSDWAANWVADPGGYYDPTGPEWSASLVLASNAVFAVGTQLYLWAFDFQSGASAQSGLFVDASWKTVTNAPLDLTPNFLGFTGGTTAIVGAYSFSGLTAATAGASAIPEPSAWAALTGLAALALAVSRRPRLRPAPIPAP
jgi:hypothetical protein